MTRISDGGKSVGGACRGGKTPPGFWSHTDTAASKAMGLTPLLLTQAPEVSQSTCETPHSLHLAQLRSPNEFDNPILALLSEVLTRQI